MSNNASSTDTATAPSSKKKRRSALDNYFHISDRGSTLSTEVRAGVVTFFAMAYIVLLNPLTWGASPITPGRSWVFPESRPSPPSPPV